MKTFQQFMTGAISISPATSWYLADISEAKGRQELFTRQSPQRLKALREHALIESAVSSNRIEGIEVDRNRIATVVFGKSHLQDRSEEEVRGYREALNLIHTQYIKLQITEETIMSLHRITRGDIWDAGLYKEKDSDIIEKHPDGIITVRFKTVSGKETPKYMQALIELWQANLQEKQIHPLILIAAFNLDFLCIHPFRDGNGRVSRLLLLLMCYHLGLEVGRYISLERLIEQNKERYYETLAACSEGWHNGKHNPWPYINFLCSIIKTAYQEFEERIGSTKSPKGEKTNMVLQAIERHSGDFRVADIQKACPNVGIDWIRRILKDLQARGHVECLGRGQGAHWCKTGKP